MIHSMTRAQAIAIITSKLAVFDDERVESLAEIAQGMDTASLRPLSDREKSLLEQSREDFKNGRTYSHDEVIDYVDARLAVLGVPKYRV